MKLEFPTFRRAFVTGMLVLAPVVVTLWVFVSLFRFVDVRIRPLVSRIPGLSDWLPESGVTGLGFVAAIVLVTLVGLLANNLVGRAVIGTFDTVINRIPWIKGVYSATKDIATVVFGDRGEAFRRVILFEYPRRGLYAIGFETNALQLSDGERMLHIFLPTTPNPTSGFFLMVPAKDAIQLPITVEDGLKLVVSGGAVVSPTNAGLLDAALASLPPQPDRTP